MTYFWPTFFLHSFWILDLPHYVYNRLAIHSHLVYCSVGLGGMFHFESWVSNLNYEDLRFLKFP